MLLASEIMLLASEIMLLASEIMLLASETEVLQVFISNIKNTCYFANIFNILNILNRNAPILTMGAFSFIILES